MAKSVLDIVIKLSKQGGADQETIKGLVSVKSAILNAAAVGGALVGAGIAIKKALDETVGTMVAYADQVRRIQNATGATAEDSSRLIQILDDQKISYEQLEKAIQKGGKAYDYSINGIAQMSDEYLKLTSSEDRAAFMQERFGKQWISFVPIMKDGGQAIRDNAAAVDDNLVLTQKAVDQARQYEIALDNWNDSVNALKISIGTGLLPAVTGLINHVNALNEADKRLREEGLVPGTKAYLDRRNEILEQVKAEQSAAAAALMHSDSLNEDTASAEENAAALKEISDAHKDMLGLIGKVASENQSYEEKAKDLAGERIKIEGERAAAINAGWWEGSQKIKDFDAALEENGQKVTELADAHHEAMGKIQYDLLVTKLSADGLTDAEFNVAQQAGLMFGVFDQQSVEQAKNMDLVAQAVEDGRIAVGDLQTALDLLPKAKSIDVVVNMLGNYKDMPVESGGVFHGYAKGGISSGPQSGHMELLHGTEAVIPLENGSIPVQISGDGAQGTGGGGSPIYVSLTIASPMTILDEQTAQNTLLPFIVNGIRTAKARGQIT